MFTESMKKIAICRAAAITVTLLAISIGSGARAQGLTVFLDQARVARLPERTNTLVVGNPLIADVTIQSGGTMVVTGKGYGITNLIALDRNGKVLAEQLVHVRSAIDTVTVFRGITRESYSCAPNCERRITLGDLPDYFDNTLGETVNRNLRAQQIQTGTGAAR